MEVTKTIKPGDKGSKAYQRRYGERLCAVRYRQSDCGSKIYTTVELIVDERPKASPGSSERSRSARRRADAVAVKVFARECEYQQLLKSAGARYSPGTRSWITTRAVAIGLGLGHRIKEGLVNECQDVDFSIEI